MLPLIPRDPPPNIPPTRGVFIQQTRERLIAIIRWPTKLGFRVRYKLRTMLLFILIFTAGGAWVSYQRSISTEQLAIAEELELSGIGVTTASTRREYMNHNCMTCESHWWREWFDEACGDRVASVSIRSELTNRDYELLQKLPQLEYLSVCNLKQIDLQRLPKANELYLEECWYIERKQLQYLDKYQKVISMIAAFPGKIWKLCSVGDRIVSITRIRSE